MNILGVQDRLGPARVPHDLLAVEKVDDKSLEPMRKPLQSDQIRTYRSILLKGTKHRAATWPAVRPKSKVLSGFRVLGRYHPKE